jgi:hypothetical protein
MIEFAEETIAGCLDELKVLTNAHWDEVRFDYGAMRVDPDWPKYMHLNSLGIIRLYTIRDWGQLIGYASFIVDDHLHFKGKKFAGNDTIYILPEYRNKFTIPRFMKYFESKLAKIGADVIQITTTKTNKHERFMKHSGYDMNQFISTKALR